MPDWHRKVPKLLKKTDLVFHGTAPESRLETSGGYGVIGGRRRGTCVAGVEGASKGFDVDTLHAAY